MASPRIVAVTGASAGIGRAVAVRLARDGASVAICARRRDQLNKVATEVEAAGGSALPFVGDVTSEDDMVQLVRLSLERYQGLDVMICNAGFGLAGTIEATSPYQMLKLLDVNYLGTYHAVRAALPCLTPETWAPRHRFFDSRRAASLHGRVFCDEIRTGGSRRSLRSELAGSNIHVTVVFPVSTETEFFDVMTRETGADVGGRRTEPELEQVADAISKRSNDPCPRYPTRKRAGSVAERICAQLLIDW
jgi:NADP-dependent 3-hydroxy acid dehydrogenase YdfG